VKSKKLKKRISAYGEIKLEKCQKKRNEGRMARWKKKKDEEISE
jgi:hypothetical protein